MATLLLRATRAQAAAAAAAAAATFAASALIVASGAASQNDDAAASRTDKLDDVLSNKGLPSTDTSAAWSGTSSSSGLTPGDPRWGLLPPARLRVPQIPLPALFGNPQACLCEGKSEDDASRQTASRRAIKRSQTIRQMGLASTKSRTLHSTYEIGNSPIGEGAFGAVYRAENKTTREPVAVKRIPKRMTDVEAFQREMNALIRIRKLGGHPHICALRESFDEGADYWLILDYISGGEMFDHLIRIGAYSEADAARLVREVAGALAFLHGVGVVHADLKPENVMLSTSKASDAVVKLVDFGCAEVLEDADEDAALFGGGGAESDGDLLGGGKSGGGGGGGGLTTAYRPPESLVKGTPVEPSVDMWSLGVILYIMLTGVHPFDMTAEKTDKEVEDSIRKGSFPLRNSKVTSHMSESSIDLIERLLESDPKKRLTADRMLEHPWVRGETASKDIIAGSDERLKKVRVFKSQLQAKFFRDVVAWSDDAEDEMRRKTSLIERSFKSFDGKNRGFLIPSDLGENFGEEGSDDGAANTDESGGASISMSDFHNLLSENMQHKFFPKGTVIYREGEVGNHMYFINSGSIEVATKDGSRATRKQGDFFGEGALLHPKQIRSATIRCKTPVHAMQIDREYFDKYLATSESGLLLTLREKDKIRKRNRAKAILRLQSNLEETDYKMGEHLFTAGEEGEYLFITESGAVDILVRGKLVFSATPGNLCGEHSVLTGHRRNSTAVCMSEDGCKAQKMSGTDFRKLIDLSPEMNTSLRDLCFRRDFKKAVVYRLKKEFPYQNPREAFDAVRINKGGDGTLSVEEISNLMKEMDPAYSDAEIHEIIEGVDLTKSGTVTFDEFKKVFIADIRTSASI